MAGCCGTHSHCPAVRTTSAARTHRIIRICERQGIPILAGRAYIGADSWVTTPRRRPPNRDLTPTQQTVNRALSATRAPIERGVARLQSWRIFRRARCSPNRISSVWTRRQLIDGIRWRTRTGAPWRDVPERYGPWDRAYDLFRRWQRDGTWARIVTHLQVSETDARGLITWDVNVDSTVCRAHQHAAGAAKRVLLWSSSS
jgi:transposase